MSEEETFRKLRQVPFNEIWLRWCKLPGYPFRGETEAVEWFRHIENCGWTTADIDAYLADKASPDYKSKLST